MNPEFQSVSTRLRAILEPHAARLKMISDEPNHYCLAIEFSPKFKKGFPVAWVKISKAYVTYHFMPVYMFPQLRERMSDKLKARMQGKACFNFKALDESLFRELENMTSDGFALARKAGIIVER